MTWTNTRKKLDAEVEALMPTVEKAAELLGLPLPFLARALTAGAHVSCNYEAGHRVGTGAVRLALLAAAAELAHSLNEDNRST